MKNQLSLRVLISVLRPPQSFKLLIIFSPALFFGHGVLWRYWPTLLVTAFAWFIASSAVYVFNDLIDLERDREEPNRAERPLVRGDLTVFQAKALVSVLAVILLCLCYLALSARASLYLGLYLLLNIGYSLGLKREVGLRQALIAVGFLLRLLAGADPIVPIPITVWATSFTLGMAYYLNCLKGIRLEASHLPQWLGAGLSGGLALVALTSLCITRAQGGSLAHPELPPLLCLVCMHRVAARSVSPEAHREQATAILKDWVTILAMFGFVTLMTG